MLNLNIALSEFFKYSRNIHPGRQAIIDKMCRKSYPDSPVSNRLLMSAYYEAQITVPYCHMGSTGAEIAFYSAERNLHWEGDYLPEPMEKYCDSPYVFFGTLLNIAAVMTESKKPKLWLIDVMNSKRIPVTVRTDIGEQMLSHLSRKSIKPVYKPVAITQPQPQLFAA